MARSRPNPASTVRLTTPTDLIASIPYLLGFHPTDSLVAVALRRREIVFTGRSTLPRAADNPREAVSRLLIAFQSSQCREALLVGFGPAVRVTPAVDAARDLFAARSILVREALRVTNDRYWSYTCDQPGCCPSEGTPFNRDGSPVPAQFTAAGYAAHRDRAALAAAVAPVDGAERHTMRVATQEVEEQWARRWPEVPIVDLARGEPEFTAEGLHLVRRITARTKASAEQPGVDEMARLSVLLCSIRVRDIAWARIGPTHLENQLALWIHVMRHAEPPYRAAPGCLAAFAAWRMGRGGLANLVLEQVAAVDPTYSMAIVLRGLLDGGVPPHRWNDVRPDWLTDPEWE